MSVSKIPKLTRELLQKVNIDGDKYFVESISEPNFTAILRGKDIDMDITIFKFRRIKSLKET